jgi:hypothetical protein
MNPASCRTYYHWRRLSHRHYFYEGQLLPEVFRNRAIHCDALPRVVRAYPTKMEGAGYRAEVTNILSTADEWFRPLMSVQPRRIALRRGLE